MAAILGMRAVSGGGAGVALRNPFDNAAAGHGKGRADEVAELWRDGKQRQCSFLKKNQKAFSDFALRSTADASPENKVFLLLFLQKKKLLAALFHRGMMFSDNSSGSG